MVERIFAGSAVLFCSVFFCTAAWAERITISTAMVSSEQSNIGTVAAIADEQSSSRPNSQWSPPFYSNSQFPAHATIDLGQERDLSELRFFDTNGVGKIQIAVGTPGVWTVVAERTTDTYGAWQSVSLARKSRYVRISQLAVDSNFSEIQLFGTPVSAVGGDASTSSSGQIFVSQEKVTWLSGRGSNIGGLVDEPSLTNPTSGWSTWDSESSALIDLGASIEVGRLRAFDSNGVGTIRIAGSNDRAAWAPIVEFITDRYQEWREIPVTATVRYLRVTKVQTDANISELRIYGKSATISPSPTPTSTSTPTPTPTPVSGESGCTGEGQLVARTPGTWSDPFPGHYLYRPRTYCQDGTKVWPLIIFLHGIGECGDGSLSQLPRVLNNQSPGDQIAKQGKHFEAILAQPQTQYWFSPQEIDLLVERVKRTNRVDVRRIYIVGLSMGGGATFTYAKDYPAKVAAIVPIAAAEGGMNAARLAGIPVWASHSFDDSTVSIANTIANIDGMYSSSMREPLMTRYPNQNSNPSWPALTDMVATPATSGEWKWEPGSTPSDLSSKGIVTIYKEGGHDAWSRTLTNPSVWEWLFRQSR